MTTSMVKYRQQVINNKMLDFTNNNKKRKDKLLNKTKLREATFFAFKKSITRIIHKFNYFDFLLLFAIVLIAAFLLNNRLQNKNTTVNVRISVENSDWWYQGSPPRIWYATDLKKGDIAKDSFGNSSAEILNIENYDNGGPYRNIYIDLKVSAQYNKRQDKYFFQYKPITVGSFLTLSFSKNQIQGIVIKMADKEIDYKYKTVKMRKGFANSDQGYIDATRTDVANNYRIGDKSYDNNNNIVAEIVDLKSQIESYYEYSDIRGENIKVFNPDFRDVELTVKLKTHSESGLDLFVNNTPIKTGSKIWIQFPKYSLENYEIVEILN